jgi:hypothetical protein
LNDRHTAKVTTWSTDLLRRAAAVLPDANVFYGFDERQDAGFRVLPSMEG